MGQPADPAVIEEDIRERDRRDSTRAVGPLTCPDDAVRFDTSTLDQAGVVNELVRLVMERV